MYYGGVMRTGYLDGLLALDHSLALLFSSFVIMGKLLSLSVPHIYHL